MFGHTHIPLRRFPQIFPVVTSIILVHTVVCIMLLFTGQSQNPEMWIRYGAVEGWRIAEGEWWRLFLAPILHTQLLQFFLINFFIYIFAPQLEWLLGRFSILLLYLVSGMIFYFVIYLFDIPGIYLGSSGAVYGFLGVYLYLFVRRSLNVQMGMGLIALTVINLILNWSLIIPYLFSILSGFVLGAMILHFRNAESE
ncbi:rhomboid family intramembrane serine protease [Thermoflavimicrobium daqui]|uniref:Peptidase S54 rhomboid domain-containing protein n=1 Tax=Thermoflavimicrobium daqui TaxID=2137476 RepID=A0A364K5Y9_9BACL|nr:rhomboid family intramembrane serine protease [Thermoflavimicrobium daqui]RAL25725.1 hypothetical protein DL897_06525 [Thermoflavimicrobium daqui]